MPQFETLLRQLGEESGEPMPDTIESPLEMEIDGLTITLSRDTRSGGEDLTLYAVLGAVPEELALEVYSIMLEANWLWSGTGFATLGARLDTREVIICYRQPLDGITPAALGDVIVTFAEIAQSWRNFVEAAASEKIVQQSEADPHHDPVATIRV